MFNRFIHILFNSSIFIPFVCAIGLSKILVERNLTIGIFAIAISVIMLMIQLVILNMAKKKIPSKNINILNIGQDRDNWILAVYITYFAPFFESYLGKNFDIGNWILILIGALLLILSKKTVNNPVWHFLGYKVYSVSTEQGVDLTLLSKKNLRNSKSVESVIRIFEYFIMEI